MDKHLHIVCWDVPWPADNSSNIDLINRIKSFKKRGTNIHLHYFGSHFRKPYELNGFCSSIHIYSKKKFTECITLNEPYVVATRNNKELIDVLNSDNHPVLIEGTPCPGILNKIKRPDRKICIRIHNELNLNHKELAHWPWNPFKKIYSRIQNYLLHKYYSKLPTEFIYACSSEQDVSFLKSRGFNKVFLVPVFPSWQQVDCPTGMGNLCLFHGDLSLPHNEKAALWLLANVFNKVFVPFVIAGKNPSVRLQKAAALCQHTCLVSNPDEEEMNDLIKKAHIHILPSLNKKTSRVQLKLLHALYKGRHCVVTTGAVEGTPLEETCYCGNNSNAIASLISQLYYKPFDEEEIDLRKQVLCNCYNNEKNIEQLIDYLW